MACSQSEIMMITSERENPLFKKVLFKSEETVQESNSNSFIGNGPFCCEGYLKMQFSRFCFSMSHYGETISKRLTLNY